MTGRHVRLDDVCLDHVPVVAPPVFTGVRGARSLRLSGEIADGTVLAELSSPGYVSWARSRIDEGRRTAGRVDDHRLTVYTQLDIGDDGRGETRRLAADVLRADGPAAGVDDQLTEHVRTLLTAIDDDQALRDAIPDAYLDHLCVSGPPDDCAAGIRALHQAGADAIVLMPSRDPETADHQLRRVAGEVLTLLDH
jgi:5,10-methylenetetrahydromethanopterin reductase